MKTHRLTTAFNDCALHVHVRYINHAGLQRVLPAIKFTIAIASLASDCSSVASGATATIAAGSADPTASLPR